VFRQNRTQGFDKEFKYVNVADRAIRTPKASWPILEGKNFPNKNKHKCRE
jgi:hypothetical protein